MLVAEASNGKFSGGNFAPPSPAPPFPPAPNSQAGAVRVLAVDGVRTLANITRLGSVSTSFSVSGGQNAFPQPGTIASVSSWLIRDGPRFVPPPLGYVPCPQAAQTCPPGLASTSGFDLGNDAADVYIFLPGAAAEKDSYGYSGLRSEFLALTGPVPSLPDEAFGTWFSWYHKYNQSAAEADIARWRHDDLPIDIWARPALARILGNFQGPPPRLE